LIGLRLRRKILVQSKDCLRRPSFTYAKHSSAAIAALSEYLILEKGFTYVLTAKAQSDKIEKQFGICRQMNGGNLYASVRQFLEAHRTIWVKNLASLNLTMSEIKDIFCDSKTDNRAECVVGES
jgi:hypothetical protein